MDVKALEALGLVVRPMGDGVEADLELTAALINPLNQRLITRVTLTAAGDRLVALSPPELVGLPPVSLEGFSRAADLENRLAADFDEYVFLLQRRSEELQALGIAGHIQPDTLVLSAEVQVDTSLFRLEADKRGKFRVAQVQQDGRPVKSELGQVFELSEFRERQALAGYLLALVNAASAPADAKVAAPAVSPVQFSEVVERFGPTAHLPSRSALEVLVRVRVGGQEYRFAAARVAGRTFRGLLAGPQGKVWAERFELEDFPGVTALVADTLRVPMEAVEVVS